MSGPLTVEQGVCPDESGVIRVICRDAQARPPEIRQVFDGVMALALRKFSRVVPKIRQSPDLQCSANVADASGYLVIARVHTAARRL
jgi:hypothetical protein